MFILYCPCPANTGPDANLGCLGFMNIWKLRLGWSLIGTKTLSFNLLSLHYSLLVVVHLEKQKLSESWNRRGRVLVNRSEFAMGILWSEARVRISHILIFRRITIFQVFVRAGSKSCVNYPNYLEIIPLNISDTSSNCFPIVSQGGLRIPAWIP